MLKKPKPALLSRLRCGVWKMCKINAFKIRHYKNQLESWGSLADFESWGAGGCAAKAWTWRSTGKAGLSCKKPQKTICCMLLVKVTCRIGSRLEMLVGNAKRSRFSSTRKKSTSLKYPVNSNLKCSAKVKWREDGCLYIVVPRLCKRLWVCTKRLR